MVFEGLRCIAGVPKEMWVLLMCRQSGRGTWLLSCRDWAVCLPGFALLAQESAATLGAAKTQQQVPNILCACSAAGCPTFHLASLQGGLRAHCSAQLAGAFCRITLFWEGNVNLRRAPLIGITVGFSLIWLGKKDIPSVSQYLKSNNICERSVKWKSKTFQGVKEQVCPNNLLLWDITSSDVKEKWGKKTKPCM